MIVPYESFLGGSRPDAGKRTRDPGFRDDVPAKRKRPQQDERDSRGGRDNRRFVPDRNRRERDDFLRRERDERRERERRREERLERRSAETSERRSRKLAESEAQKTDERSLNLRRVLALDSHEEQVDRFVQILQDRNAQSARRDTSAIPGLMDNFEENLARRMRGEFGSSFRPTVSLMKLY